MQGLVTDAPQLAANDFVMAREIAETLHKHYPGHLWAVTCQGDQGIATIRNLSLSGNWGFILHLPKIYSASEFGVRVVRGGGELLERYRVSRGRARHDELAALRTDFAGNHVADRG